MTTPKRAPAGTVVVGHDGAEGADRALQTALEVAEALEAPVQVVRCWLIGYPPAELIEDGYVLPIDEIDSRERRALIRRVRPFHDEHPTVRIECRAERGQPVETFLAIARDARMLVVGSRGRGGFAALLLGSVSELCLHHAACPVLVVPRRRGGAHASE